MMRILVALFILSFFSACSQTSKKTLPVKTITRNVEQDIKNLIPSGNIDVDIMDQVTVSPRMQELQTRFLAAVKKNYEWFAAQRKINESTGKELSYDPKVGMTKEEWEEYKILSDTQSGIQIASSGIAKVLVIKGDDYISFNTHNENYFI